MRIVFYIVSIVALTQITGCITDTLYTDLTYPPDRLVEFDKRTAQPSVVGPRTQQILLTVIDAHGFGDRICTGPTNSGLMSFGLAAAVGARENLLTEDNGKIWAHEAIVMELNLLGYQVATSNQGQPTVIDQLTVELKNVLCLLGYPIGSNITLQGTLLRDGAEPLVKTFKGRASVTQPFSHRGESAGESLARALQTAVGDMLYDFGFNN